MKYRWLLSEPRPLLTRALTSELAVPPLLAECLVNRGFTTAPAAAAFLRPKLRQLRDPELIPNLSAAVARLWRAREQGEPLVVFGDYDVDGVTATALLLEVFHALGWRADAYLPHRLDEGYGLTLDAVENCLQRFPVRLLLAVDCGSTASETISWLNRRGVEVIVLDHHQISDPPPAAVALVNPQLAGEAEPGFRELCSAGLAFKLAHALVKRGRQLGLPAAEAFDVRPLLDYAALGTIADLVPLIGENRILAAAGLERLNALHRPGLRALKEVAAVPGRIGPFEVAFQLAPRLNAVGRLEHAAQALELLRAPDLATAEPLAAALDAQNAERQAIERGIAEEVIGAVRARFDPQNDFVIVEGQLLWHVGVVGIVASRVLSEFYRPTIILGGDGHEWRGSGRSIEGFDLAAALRECSDLLIRHGGHAMAAGLTVAPDKVPVLRARLNDIARRRLRPEQLVPPLRLDAECGVTDLTLELLDQLALLQPTGQGNPPVHVVVRNVRHRREPMKLGREHQHAKFWVTDGDSTVEVLWWTGGDKPWPTGVFDVAGIPQVNEFDGRRTVQLRLLDWQPAG
ncbi:MAG: single-stranded-DNA-specific exonuclease RecJ [Verrucomicrobia bacterium]|jgi:single-stranded-DNA-specific exonuclease|nr:single-stranded-DNA-specific exonuclease RecJ [Verrucomicrobiota bacterium]